VSDQSNSPAQLKALMVVERGDAFYQPYWGRIFGIRTDTFNVLMRRGLVAIPKRDLNPGERDSGRRWAVVLTDSGRKALSEHRAVE
jgi:hypothetical protein